MMNSFAIEKIEYYNKRLEEYERETREIESKIESFKKEIKKMELKFDFYLKESNSSNISIQPKKHYNDFSLLLNSISLQEFLFYVKTVNNITVEEINFLLQRLELKKQLRQYKTNLKLLKNTMNYIDDIIKEFKKYNRCLTGEDFYNNKIYINSILIKY